MNKIAMDQLIGNDHASLLGQMTFGELFEAMAGGPEALGRALAAYRTGARPNTGHPLAEAVMPPGSAPQLPETGRGYAYGQTGMPPKAQGNAYGRLDVPKDQRGAGRATVPAIPAVPAGAPPVFVPPGTVRTGPVLPTRAKRPVRS